MAAAAHLPSTDRRAIAALPGSDRPQWVAAPPVEEPGVGEVRCRTLELGVCGTDREILHSREPWAPPGQPHLILGHECLARVEAVGPQVDPHWRGQLVVPVVRRPTVDSPIRPDLLAFGRYIERGIVHAHGFSSPTWLDRPEYLVPVEAELAPWAVLAEPISVSEKGVNEALVVQQARLGADAWRAAPPRVLVTGLGPIAFTALLACGARGWPVTVFGRDEATSYRARLVRAFGGAYFGAAESADRFEPANVEANGFDLILECTGSDEVLLAAAGALAALGVMVWLGASRTPQTRPHNVDHLMRLAVLRNHLHLGSVNAARRDFDAALADLTYWRRVAPDALSGLITHRVAFDDALPHYTARVPQAIKAVVMYE